MAVADTFGGLRTLPSPARSSPAPAVSPSPHGHVTAEGAIASSVPTLLAQSYRLRV
eukprot:NODE_21574_length_746_cov_3.287561.p5 GENE.NODE_21574_length_746_cov_3.287561~~NODE_21574_length_746_cov_3.287561.p5  ORF type:complete len:56 (+),score=11.50 NODE_21574_length_746_cov_3.287561:281-448(+)